jgi:CheY-like chemotaxis protein
MSTLLIHNENLPRKLINDDRFKSVSFRPPKSEIIQENFSYDAFADQKLEEILKENYDVIVIPYTLSTDNYLELTGLRIGLHIRLTFALNHWDKPIIFIGNESREIIAKLSYLGSFLFTPGVFAIKEQDPDSILEVIGSINRDWRKNNSNKLTKQDFKTFLNKIIIHPPANYQTHHSIANEWGVIRLSESIKLDEKTKTDIYQLFKDNILINLLYFKYTEALYNRQNRQKFKNKHKEEINIDKIKDKKIVYIDDEYHKGWEVLLNYILHHQSEALPLNIYKNFQKEWDKNTLLDKIKQWLHNYQNDNKPIDADIFIIDLRLHDDDFNDPNEISNMSGIQIIDYLKNDKNYGNPGRQVIIFTASNKIWNFKEAEKYGVDGFIMKESPEFSFTRDDTEKHRNDLIKTIKKAGEKTYLKDVYLKIKKIKNNFYHKDIDKEPVKDFKTNLCSINGWLDQAFNSLLKSNTFHGKYLSTIILFQVLEN